MFFPPELKLKYIEEKLADRNMLVKQPGHVHGVALGMRRVMECFSKPSNRFLSHIQ